MKKVINLMNVRRFLGLMLVICFMAGCTSSNKTVYSYSPPTTVDGRACVDECVQSKEICMNQCNTPNAQCIAMKEQKAKRAYEHYASVHQSTGQPLSRSFESFYHPEKCQHAGCGCEQNYEVCHQLCGSRTEIHESLAME